MPVFPVDTRVMLVATFTRGETDRVISAVHTPEALTETGELRCVVCGDRVEPRVTPTGPEYEFEHVSGDPACTGSERMTVPHQQAVEMSILQVSTVASASSSVSVEKRVGDATQFVTADVYCSGADDEFAVEVYHKSASLGLRRRLRTYFANDVTVFLVFVSGIGRYNPTRVEQHLQGAATGELHVGRFNPETFEISIGTPLTAGGVSVSRLTRSDVPAYIS